MELDPRILRLQEVLRDRLALAGPRGPDTREAAVAVLVRPREELEILLIKRAEHEKDPWSGHMALPGGRRDPDDADLLTTALREAEEEIGADFPAWTSEQVKSTTRPPWPNAGRCGGTGGKLRQS